MSFWGFIKEYWTVVSDTDRRIVEAQLRFARDLCEQERRRHLWRTIPYVTVAECGHCFEDVGERV